MCLSVYVCRICCAIRYTVKGTVIIVIIVAAESTGQTGTDVYYYLTHTRTHAHMTARWLVTDAGGVS